MEPKYKIEGNIALFTCKGLYVTATYGRVENSLHNIQSLEEISEEEIHISPISHMGEGVYPIDFFAAFHFKPPIDITMTRSPNDRSATIITYSLNKEKSRDLVKTLEEKTGFVSEFPPKWFIEKVAVGAKDKSIHYLMLRKKHENNQTALENAFGFDFYKSFLALRFQMSKAERNTKAAEYFIVSK